MPEPEISDDAAQGPNARPGAPTPMPTAAVPPGFSGNGGLRRSVPEPETSDGTAQGADVRTDEATPTPITAVSPVASDNEVSQPKVPPEHDSSGDAILSLPSQEQIVSTVCATSERAPEPTALMMGVSSKGLKETPVPPRSLSVPDDANHSQSASGNS